MSTSKNKDINNKSKQNYPNYQMQEVVESQQIHPTGEQLSINVLVKFGGIIISIQCHVYLQCSYLQVFFIIKLYFPNLDWVGHEKCFVRLDGL